ncbi:MAG: 1-acyl-sn-glycerol-3-phosphate acyltransferase, partial [bacterium]
PVVLMSPLTFMARPEKWLWAIHRFRGTLSGGVNFAYELCLSKIRERSLEGLDLTSWRFAFNGAEPISPETLLGFQQRFAPYGFDPKAMAPVYGLAESSVGLAFPALGRGPLLDRVGRDLFLREGRALPAGQGAADALRFVACGHPLPGHQIRIVDGRGHEVGERQSGRLQFMGPSATSGYFRNAEATRGLFEGDWLDSGDIAYVAGGEVYLTGRVKDVIIRAGRNLHPYELEDAVGGLAGIRKGNVAVFGSAQGGDGTERLVVVAETRLRDPEQRRELERRIEEQSMLLVGSPPDDVVLAPAHSVLKTSSGKIRRAAVRELFERGAFGGSAAGRWWVARVALGGALARLRLLRRRVVEWSYGGWAYAVIGGVGLVAWALIAIMPRPRWAWGVARRAARLVLALARIPVHVQGLEHLPRDRPFVMVANHSSYLDPLVLAAVIPIDMTYVAKGELAASFISRIFLRRLDSELVERFESQKGAQDAERVAGRLARGNSLMYFPEGTFRRAPGLAPFHMGAFTAAAPAGAPLVPVSLRGTRTLLREGEWLPRRTAVAVRIAPPEWPDGSDWNAALKLRDACRGALLRHGGEPDLAAEG